VPDKSILTSAIGAKTISGPFLKGGFLIRTEGKNKPSHLNEFRLWFQYVGFGKCNIALGKTARRANQMFPVQTNERAFYLPNPHLNGIVAREGSFKLSWWPPC